VIGSIGLPNFSMVILMKMLADTDHALKDVREIGQAASLIFALVFASFHHVHCGNYVAANAEANELVALGEESSLLWKTFGTLNQGCLLAENGKTSDAVQLLISGVTAWRSTGATLLCRGSYRNWREPTRNSANSMMLGVALTKR
jgi:hypothetical protein